MHIAGRMSIAAVVPLLWTLSGAAADPNEPRPASEGMPLLTLAGANSRIDEPTCLRITSAEEFQAVYMRHLGEDPKRFDQFYNPHGVPMIDFERCMVLAVFQGQRSNTAGVYVHSAVEEQGRLIVRVEDRTYQTAGPDGGGRRATPYGMFVLPRCEKELLVQLDVRRIKGAPPEWEQLARFAALAAEE